MAAAPSSFDAIVIGAGAAGMLCAAEAGKRGRRILLIDHAERARREDPDLRRRALQFHQHPHRARPLPQRQPAFRQVGAGPLHAAGFHRLGRALRHCLARKDAGATVLRRLGAADCRPAARRMRGGRGRASAWARASPRSSMVTARSGSTSAAARPPRRRWSSPCGGLSIPKLGATGFAYDVARRFGLKVIEPRPALVPLTLGGDDVLFRTLSGVAAPVEVRCGKAAFREAALFTHRGLSGPAILQISSYWRHGEPIAVDFLPDAPPGWLRDAKRGTPACQAFAEHWRPRFRTASPKRLPTGSPSKNRSPTRPIGSSKRPKIASPHGHSIPTAPKASPRPKSPSAGSPPPSCRRRPWRRSACPVSTRSARRSMSPAGSAAIIFNGPGPAPGPRADALGLIATKAAAAP